MASTAPNNRSSRAPRDAPKVIMIGSASRLSTKPAPEKITPPAIQPPPGYPITAETIDVGFMGMNKEKLAFGYYVRNVSRSKIVAACNKPISLQSRNGPAEEMPTAVPLNSLALPATDHFHAAQVILVHVNRCGINDPIGDIDTLRNINTQLPGDLITELQIFATLHQLGIKQSRIDSSLRDGILSKVRERILSPKELKFMLTQCAFDKGLPKLALRKLVDYFHETEPSKIAKLTQICQRHGQGALIAEVKAEVQEKKDARDAKREARGQERLAASAARNASHQNGEQQQGTTGVSLMAYVKPARKNNQ